MVGMSQIFTQVKIDSSKASLLLQSKRAEVKIDRERGGFDMDSHPIQLDIDNRAFFDSMGLKSISALADDLAARGQKAALESIAQYVREGNMMASPQGDGAISQIAIMRTQKNIESMLAFMPENPPKMNWTDGYVDIKYSPDELRFQWDAGGVEKTYIPYSIHFSAEKQEDD